MGSIARPAVFSGRVILPLRRPFVDERAWEQVLRLGETPLTNAVSYFLDAVQGGDRRLCDVALTLRITRVLAACDATMGRR